MIDLKEVSGLNIQYDEQNQKLVFGDDIVEVNPEPRILGEERKVLLNPDIAGDDNQVLYLMHRGVCRKEDSDLFKKYNLRYDITVIFPLALGEEFNKTIGHYHPLVPGKNMTFSEVYEVLFSRSHHLIQDIDWQRGSFKVNDVKLIKAETGDKVLIPSNYGHITINPDSDSVLILNNLWADLDFFNLSSIYEPYQKAHGGVYFGLKNGQFIKNENYQNIPELIIEKAKDYPDLGLVKDKSLYRAFIEEPEKFKWLLNPQDI